MKINIQKQETFYSKDEALGCQAQHAGAEITFREGHGLMLNGEWTYDIPENRPAWIVTWTEAADAVEFDSTDLDGMRRLMDEYGGSRASFDGTNENIEQVSISIAKDRIDVVTFQDNGWTRRNVYWRDGTREELYEGKWK